MNLRTAAIIAFLFVPAFVSAQVNDRAKYINYEYKSVLPGKALPNGVIAMGGGLIGDVFADPVYEIAEVKKGKTKMLWFNVSTGTDSTGVTGWKVLDVLSFPALLKTDYIYMTGDPSIECRRKDEEIPNLVGVGRIIPRQGTFKLSKLWVANLTTKKFEVTGLTGIKCTYSEP